MKIDVFYKKKIDKMKPINSNKFDEFISNNDLNWKNKTLLIKIKKLKKKYDAFKNEYAK